VKKRNRIVALVVALITFGGVGIASARWFGHHGGDRMGHMKKFVEWRIDDALSEIDATDEQKTRIKAIADGVFADMEGRFGEREKTRVAFVAEFKSDAPDKKAVRALIDDRIEAARQMAYAAADAAFEVHGTLEPEQRAKVLEMIESHHK
jgi:Spy/CpxP family protein refolding chaperone